MKLDARINQFADLVQRGVDAWVEAGKILCEMVAEDSEVREKICDRVSWMTMEVLDGFERIGRKDVYPFLLLDQSPGAHRLIRLDYETQKKFYDAEIAVAVLRRGEIVTESKRLNQLSWKEADTAISDTGIRPIAEQRKLLQPKLTIRQVAPKVECIAKEPEEVESLDSEPETPDAIDTHLARAQAELLKVRELLGDRNTRAFEKHITNGLNAIGGLRFELKEQKKAA